MVSPESLLEAAVKVSKNAYAPFSKYRVGAALLTSRGEIISGCNVENASYGLTNCAERTALFSAVAVGETEFDAIAIISSSLPLPLPCGACRQVLAEFCRPDMPVYTACADDLEHVTTYTLGELLPHSFKLD